MAISVNFDGRLIKQLGAYVKTDLSAVRQINGTATGIVALLGLAEGGEPNTPYRILNYAEAVEIFKGGPLLDHIKSALLGGAGEIVAVRVGSPSSAMLSIDTNDSSDPDATTAPWKFISLEKSTRSNSIYVSFELDTNFTSITRDDYLVLTVQQRNPDGSTTREVYLFPRFFTDTVVLVRRGDQLFFVDRAIINAAKAVGSGWQTALINLLKNELQSDDYVQIFDASTTTPVDVPLGLVLYEINYGGLFGFNKSRLVRTEFGSVSDILSNSLLFGDVSTLRKFHDGSSYATFAQLVANIVAKSGFSVDDIVNNTVNPTFLTNGIFVLSGGTNGDDGTGYYQAPISNYSTVWLNALSSLETEEVNFVVPAYRFKKETSLSSRLNWFKTVASTVLSHVNLQSQAHIRRRRVAIFGLPAPSETESYTSSEYLNDQGILSTVTSMFGGSDRVQAIVSPFYSPVFSPSGKKELLGAEFLASYVAGMHANREPQVSLTFLPISGLGYEPLYDWKYSEKDELISNRVFFIERVRNTFGAIVYRIHHNPTTWTGPVTSGYQEMVLRRIDDFLTAYLYKNLEAQFVGRPSFGAKTASDIKAYTETLLSRVVDKQIAAFQGVEVTPNEDKTVYYVSFYFQPVNEVKFILVTMKVSFELA